MKLHIENKTKEDLKVNSAIPLGRRVETVSYKAYESAPPPSVPLRESRERRAKISKKARAKSRRDDTDDSEEIEQSEEEDDVSSEQSTDKVSGRSRTSLKGMYTELSTGEESNGTNSDVDVSEADESLTKILHGLVILFL